MEIGVKILDERASWEHQLSIYQGYHQKYAKVYPAENFFYHPYLLEKFSKSNLSAEELKEVETYFKTKIYDKEKLEKAKKIVEEKAISFVLEKNELLQKLPIKHPEKLTINLSGAMSGGFYNADKNEITLSPQCVTPNFMPLLVTHEFTHICVEDDVKKYQLPHLAKERLVSKICAEVLDFDDHNSVGDKAIDKFLSKENLENNYAQTLSDIQNLYRQQQQILQQGKIAETQKGL